MINFKTSIIKNHLNDRYVNKITGITTRAAQCSKNFTSFAKTLYELFINRTIKPQKLTIWQNAL